MPLHPRDNIEGLQTCSHGGPDYAELQELDLAPGEVIDFSVNSNPFGPPTAVQKALSSAIIHRYPDRECIDLRRCLAQRLGVFPENILAGNGSVELIRLAAMAYLGTGDQALIIEPTFGEYEVACLISGAELIKYQLKAEDGFKLRVDGIIDLIERCRPRAVFLCNPNNPTGQYLSKEDFRRIPDTCDDSLLVLDEAYIPFVDEPWSSLDMIDDNNLLVLRSMTKDYALAGLRLGYAVASKEIIQVLRSVCPPWNVNAIAQQAGIVALNEDEYLADCKDGLSQAKDYLISELTSLGLPPVPSKTNFFLVKVGNARSSRAALLKQGLLVRDCTSFGLSEYVRISLRTLSECRKLVTSIRDLGWRPDV